ncbi:hypothetical protein JCM11491_005102 [Sporobolomyces phaffii]
MLPFDRLRPAPAAAPLLSFPPSPPRPPRLAPIDHTPARGHGHGRTPSTSSQSLTSLLQGRARRRRSLRAQCYAGLQAVPLAFIYGLLSFSAYVVVYSLALDYLAFGRDRYAAAAGVVATYAACLFGSAASLAMCCAASRDNFVPLDDDDDDDDRVGQEPREDEEDTIGLLADGPGRRLAAADRSENDDDDSDANRTRSTLQVKSDGTQRFCRKCNILKPDRAHHCSTCQRCVLKMDHHCPWLGGGCVGYANYKFFVQFLLYTGLLGIYVSIVCFYSLVHYTSDEPSGYEMAPISWALAALLGVIFGSATGLFGLYHLYLAATNRTTIEAMESPTTFATTLPPRHLVDAFLARAHAHAHAHAARTTPTPTPTPTPVRLATRAEVVLQLAARLSRHQRVRLERAKRRHCAYDLAGGWRANLREVFLADGDAESRNRTYSRDDRRGGGGGGLASARTTTTSRWWEWIAPWGRPAGDGYSFPLNFDHLDTLEDVAREIWAEVEADERARTATTTTRPPDLQHTRRVMSKRQLTLAEALKGPSSPTSKRPRLSSPRATHIPSSVASPATPAATKSTSTSTAMAAAAAFSVEAYRAKLSTAGDAPTEADLLRLECDTLDPSWLSLLQDEIRKPYFNQLKRFLWTEGLRGAKDATTTKGNLTVLPPARDVYSWSRFTPLEHVKVVILGQDPYHDVGQAHGLCFSVRPGVKVPPSLRNIYKEIHDEYPAFAVPRHGSLTSLARSGVLLLNTSLTVAPHRAGSHSGKGWETFTDAVVDLVDRYAGSGRAGAEGTGVVVLAWGAWAAKRVAKMDKKKHLILTSPHPSPLSARRGFFGNGHFKKANAWLEEKYGADAKIDWTKIEVEDEAK